MPNFLCVNTTTQLRFANKVISANALSYIDGIIIIIIIIFFLFTRGTFIPPGLDIKESCVIYTIMVAAGPIRPKRQRSHGTEQN